jgi:hypothetical protein
MCRKTDDIRASKGSIALPENILASKTESSEIKNSQEKQPIDCKRTPSRRRVRFACFNNVVHESEPMSSQEFEDYYMQDEDFERCDEDIKESIIKWIRHELGRENDDQEEFSVRGLEEMIDHIQTMHCAKKSKHEESQRHIQTVLQAVREQQTSGAADLDTEKIRLVSERSSALALHQALQAAEKDESELHVADKKQPPNPPACPIPQSKPLGQDCTPPMHKSTKAQRIISFFKRASRCPCE